jgi:hypothetical protein
MEYEKSFLLNELPEETPPMPPMTPPPPEAPSVTLKELIERFWEGGKTVGTLAPGAKKKQGPMTLPLKLASSGIELHFSSISTTN